MHHARWLSIVLVVVFATTACGGGGGSESGSGLRPFELDVDTIGLWHLDEAAGTITADASGNAFDLLLTSTEASEASEPWWQATGLFGACLQFSPALAIRASGTYAIPLAAGQVSVELWYRTTTSGGLLFDTGETGCRLTWQTGPDRLLFAVDNGVLTQTITLSDPNALQWLQNGSWHYVAGTFDGETLRLYVDGQEQGSVAGALTLPNPSAVRIGGAPLDAASYVTGEIDEVRLSSRARTAAEIFAAANGTTP